MRILILGGTAEARELANTLYAQGHEVTTSLAGRTADPRLPRGDVRVGKFGGIPGLCAYLSAGRIDRLIDATHPYAGLISANAVVAAKAMNVPMLRLMRAPWQEPEGAGWLHARDAAEAAALLPVNADVLLTTGHTGLDAFLMRDDCSFLVRVIEPPAQRLPPHARLLLARPPHAYEDERNLMVNEDITHLVTKNSGGTQTFAKLEAARRLGVKVVMLARPVYPPALEVASVAEALEALHLSVPA